jgi:hypothetical protein
MQAREEDTMSRLPPALEEALNDPAIRRRRTGEVLLTLNQLVLMQALRDFPDALAPSVSAWVGRAMLYRDRTGGGSEYTLLKSARRVPEVYVARRRAGPCLAVALAPLGVAVLDLVVPAWIVGRGAYRGFRALVTPRGDG